MTRPTPEQIAEAVELMEHSYFPDQTREAAKRVLIQAATEQLEWVDALQRFPRLMKLISKRKKFIIVAEDEPYFHEVYIKIKYEELRKGTWTEECEVEYEEVRKRHTKEALTLLPPPAKGDGTEKRYAVTDNGDYEWIIDTTTGNEVDPRTICDMLNSPAAPAWMPIESAPRDGTWILAFWPRMGITHYPALIFYDAGVYANPNAWTWASDIDYGEVYPTHWMPLPPPPEKKDAT